MMEGISGKLTPTVTEQTVPIINWPEAPMLKRPALNATATERPVKIAGVILRTVVAQARPVPKAPLKRPL